MYHRVEKFATRRPLYFAALCICLVLSACALLTGKEPGLKHASTFHVAAPGGWKLKDQKESDQAYTLPSGTVVTLNSACNRDTTVALDLLTRHLLIGLRNVNYLKRDPVTIDGAVGQLTSVRASDEGVPFYLNLFVLPKDGCIFDFSLVSPKPVPQEETDAFLTFVKSFHYGKN